MTNRVTGRLDISTSSAWVDVAREELVVSRGNFDKPPTTNNKHANLVDSLKTFKVNLPKILGLKPRPLGRL
jgi:hypothetical protein